MACRCDSFIEPGTDPKLPCPACWDAWHTGAPFLRDGASYEVTHRVEGTLSAGVKVWYGWKPSQG